MLKSLAGRREARSRQRRATGNLMEESRLVGWREWVALPDLGIDRIRTKVDTGAQSAALHATKIRPFERDGETWVSFVARAGGARDGKRVQCEARVLGTRKVKNSGGGVERRFVIVTPLVIGDRRFDVQITLTNRAQMGHEMLLGRSALREGRFLVHPSKSHLQPHPASLVNRRAGE